MALSQEVRLCALSYSVVVSSRWAAGVLLNLKLPYAQSGEELSGWTLLIRWPKNVSFWVGKIKKIGVFYTEGVGKYSSGVMLETKFEYIYRSM